VDGFLHIPMHPRLADGLEISSIVCTFGLLMFFAYLFVDHALQAQAAASSEHARSEQLLLNILPEAIANRLKSDDHAIADGFAEVTVLFADIVGFTELSARLSPDEIVRMLNRIFPRLMI